MAIKNYIKLTNFSLFNYYYVFVDAPEYLADQIFIKNKVRVKFSKHMAHPETQYLIIFCKIHKKDEKAFLKSLEELPTKMSLLGYKDYEEGCKLFISMIEE